MKEEKLVSFLDRIYWVKKKKTKLKTLEMMYQK